MRQGRIGLLAIAAACFVMMGCGSSNTTQTNTAATQTSQTTQTTQPEDAGPGVDCDVFMQQLADGCYAVTAFDADGVTPLHVVDEAGNDLGEVDQQWAAAYCQCYAQMAFQTFGCTAVVGHEQLDDDAYAQTYEPIVATCADTTMGN